MPNTTPIPELIALKLVERLEAITVFNGYAFDVAEVTRPNRFGTNTNYRHLGIIVEQLNATRNTLIDIPGNPPAIGWNQEFAIRCLTRDRQEEDGHAINENEMAANTLKAITSVDNWWTMNGNAIDMQIGDLQPFESPIGELNGLTIPLVVSYRVNENNPFAVR